MTRNSILRAGLLLALVAVSAIAQAVGVPILSPDQLALGGLLLIGVGEIDGEGLKDLLQKQGEAFDQFKKANDARLAAIESKGFAPADLVGKVDVINADLNKLGKEIDEIIKQGNRPPAPGDEKNVSAEQREHKQVFESYLRKGDANGLKDLERKAMTSLNDQQGGYLITHEMDAAIDRVVPTLSAMFRIAKVVNVGTQKWLKRVKTSGMTMARPGQGSTSGETTPPLFARMEIEAHLAEVEPWVENETLEDADIDLAMDLADEAAVAFAEGLGAEFITGNGVAKSRGITAYDTVANASWAWGKIGYVASGKSAAFASVAPADKIIDLQHALKPQYRNGAVFVMSDATLATVRQMKDSSGAYYLWQPDTTAGFGGRLLGSPVEVDDNMPVVAANSLSMAYGDFARSYAIVNRRGTALIRDNLTQKGVTKFNFTRRVGGGVYNFQAIKLMKFATS